MFIALRLSKLGYYGGDPEKILNAPVGLIFDILSFEDFEAQYESLFIEMNRGDE